MKKLLLVFISLLLAPSMLSCDIQGVIDGIIEDISPSQTEKPSTESEESEDEEEDEDDEEEDDEEEDDEESSEPSSESSSQTPAPPQFSYGPDTTVYSNEVTSDGKWIYGSYSLKAPVFSNYYNGYTSALTFTFDDGYDTGTGEFVNSIFEQYGFRGTAMLGPCFLNDTNIPIWNKILAKGYLDVGCHGYDHEEPTTLAQSKYEHEIKDAIYFLREKFPTQRVLTFATPYAHINDSYEAYLDDFVISNRLELGGELVQVGEDYNMYRVKSYSFNRDAIVENHNQIIAGNLKKNGAWVVELVHCVLDGAYNSTDISKEKFAQHCSYLNSTFKNTVWFASFEDVSIYLKQVENAKINYVASDKESMTINVTCDLDKNIYNIPMTAKLQIPFTINSAYAVIDGVEYDLSVSKGSGVNTVTVRDLPVNGSDVKIYFGGNDACDNGCAHMYQYDENISATCQSRGYTVGTCIICGNSFKTKYTKVKEHELSDERVVEKEPTSTENGLITIKCLNCDYKKEIITSIADITESGTLTTTDGINQWVYPSDIIDGNKGTAWVCGTNNPEIVLAFNEKYVTKTEITLKRSLGVAQKFTVSAYDGEAWHEIGSWDYNEDTSTDDIITLSFDVNMNAKQIKYYFDSSASGCTSINEITVLAINEQEKK